MLSTVSFDWFVWLATWGSTQLPAGQPSLYVTWISRQPHPRSNGVFYEANCHKNNMTLFATWWMMLWKYLPKNAKKTYKKKLCRWFYRQLLNQWGLIGLWVSVLLIRSLMILSDSCWRSAARPSWVSIGTHTQWDFLKPFTNIFVLIPFWFSGSYFSTLETKNIPKYSL